MMVRGKRSNCHPSLHLVLFSLHHSLSFHSILYHVSSIMSSPFSIANLSLALVQAPRANLHSSVRPSILHSTVSTPSSRPLAMLVIASLPPPPRTALLLHCTYANYLPVHTHSPSQLLRSSHLSALTKFSAYKVNSL